MIPTVTKCSPASVETLSVSLNFRMSQFTMFNGSRNLTQHLAHYISRCGPVIKDPPAVRGALLLQFFMQSLERATFTWYVTCSEGSIVSWHAIEQNFLK